MQVSHFDILISYTYIPSVRKCDMAIYNLMIISLNSVSLILKVTGTSNIRDLLVSMWLVNTMSPGSDDYIIISLNHN